MGNNTIFVGGLQRQSFLDYPGEVSCVVFLSGCNMRCHYCHNSQLFDLAENKMPLSEVLQYIEKNRRLLGAVVISGGEPTVCPQLPDIIRQIRAVGTGLKIKLDTNGTRFDVVKQLVTGGLVDFVALDIKAPIKKYKDITGFYNDDILRTADFLKTAKCKYMFRTTISPQLTEDDIHEMGKAFVNGAAVWQIQQFNPNEYSNSFDTVLLPYTPEKVRFFAKIAGGYAQHIVVRGL